MSKTPRYIISKLRQRRDLDSRDGSQDADIEAMSPMEKLREVTTWELGSPSWADTFLNWARDCGMEVNECKEPKQ